MGLDGQLRSVFQIELSLKQAAKLGLKQAIIFKGKKAPEVLGIEIISVGKVIDAIISAIPAQPLSESVS